MTTEQAIDLLSASLDRPLTATEQSALDIWLAADPEHRTLADGLRGQHADLKTTFEPRREAVSQVVARVASALPTVAPAAPPENPRWQRHFTPVAGAVAAAVVIGLGLWAFKGKNQQPTTHPERAIADATPINGMKPREKPKAPESKKLEVNETIATAAGEKRRVILPDGSILYVNQNTTAVLTADRHLKLTKGDVFIESVPADETRGKFQVETPARSVTALGTKFAVSAVQAGTGVIVTQGSVEVSDLAEPVASGQQLTAGDMKPSQAPRGACAVEWTRDLMIAAEAPLVPAGKHSGGSLVAVDPYGQEAKLNLVKFHIDVHVEEGFARTTIDQTFFNNENQQLEGTFYFPLPPDASLNRLAMYVEGNRMEGGMAERDHARNVYETIRHQRRDPALLEWVDGSVFKMRVFPLPAREEKRIVLSYTQKLNATYGRSTYRFPSGHSLSHVEQWSFNATLKNAATWSVASPSHPTMKNAEQGQDIVLTDKANNARIDRDVVVELADHAAAAQAPGATQFTAFTQDGQRYMMMRYKPDLPMAQRRERRDWVFLFESSGARDPLVARTQVEVIRALLHHAEHEDTFTVLTVGTRVRAFTPGRVPATGENAAKAVAWLEQAHLIGALNLEDGFTQAAAHLAGARNPHVVHVGGGIASYGEQRPDKLMAKLPAGAKYVGVAVGKRFSPTLMKTAAEKTGGLFTAINPDEPVAWRGFELASTLNAPRLLNVALEAGGTDAKFLPFAGSVAHGEELVAVANITGAQPTQVRVTGLLDGQKFDTLLAVKTITPGAGHLPRSWAKLEIDRLLADTAHNNQTFITNLSKQMYVMTPYTSLLVLENEQMYTDFKVDRGRKDHWAMYAAPDKIPVVHVPDPNAPFAARGTTAGQKPHENQVLSTIFTRQPAMVLHGPNLPGQPTAVQNAAQRFGAFIAVPDDAVALGDSDEDAFQHLLLSVEEVQSGSFMLGAGINSDAGVTGGDVVAKLKNLRREKNAIQLFDAEQAFDLPALQTANRTMLRVENNRRPARPAADRLHRLSAERSVKLAIRGENDGEGLTEGFAQWGEFDGRMSGKRAKLAELSDGLPTSLGRGRGVQKQEDLTKSFDESRFARNGLLSIADPRGTTHGTPLSWEFRDGAETDLKRFSKNRDLLAESEQLAQVTNGMYFRQLGVDGSEPRPVAADPAPIMADIPYPVEALGFQALRDARYGFHVSEPAYYTRPGFHFTERLFRDLPSFAPGMSSSPADVRAAVEAEAAPRFGTRRGSIDPAAKKLFDMARAGMGWRVTKVPQADGTILAVTHDGLGRYAYERAVAFGLKESVRCDGTTLWHTYPEIGLGATRAVSRFHRAELLALIPDALPPADDLNYGADVKLVSADTVAVVPHHPLDDNGNPVPWRETHYVFKNGRLAEIFGVRQPANKPSAKMTYAADGTLTLVGTDGKAIGTAKVDFVVAAEPAPTPDAKGLVVLPLPLRGREVVYPRIGLDPNYNFNDGPNLCWEYLNDDALLELLASEFGTGSGNISAIINLLRTKNDDRRPGLNVLLATLNYAPIHNSGYEADTEDLIRRDPLSRYLFREFDQDTREWNKKLGFALPAEPKTDFLSRLGTLRVIYDRFTGGYVNHSLWGVRDAEVKRALKYVDQRPSSALGWAALGLVSDVTSSDEMQAEKAARWGVMFEKSRFPYAARYEQARMLDRAGRGDEAMKKFQELFKDALSVGVLPSVDDQFRTVLGRKAAADWPTLMKEMAAKCAENKARPVVVLLAWQCWQLGDVALSDTVLEAALKDAPEAEKPLVTLWAVQFLNGTNRPDRADALMQPLLENTKTAAAPAVWRLASQVSAARGDQVKSIEHLEKALDLEFARLPDVFDINPIRNDYSRLLAHYEWLADAATKLKVPTPADLPTRLVKAVDRWRQVDPEPESICHRSGVVLRKIGHAEATALAWDYETTPLALKPNEAGPWESLAHRLRLEGDWKLADRAYEMAFLAEPTNAQLLWNRAQHLKDKGQIAESRAVFKQLADGEWQPRFQGLASMAKGAAEGR